MELLRTTNSSIPPLYINPENYEGFWYRTYLDDGSVRHNPTQALYAASAAWIAQHFPMGWDSERAAAVGISGPTFHSRRQTARWFSKHILELEPSTALSFHNIRATLRVEIKSERHCRFQRLRRALQRIFTNDEVRIYRGDVSRTCKDTVVVEQAIGDFWYCDQIQIALGKALPAGYLEMGTIQQVFRDRMSRDWNGLDILWSEHTASCCKWFAVERVYQAFQQATLKARQNKGFPLTSFGTLQSLISDCLVPMSTVLDCDLCACVLQKL